MDNAMAGGDRNLDMKLNASLIRRMRDERAWSQERLAEAAGLGIRTVQRVESDGSASHETRLALAGVFGVDVQVLSAAQLAPTGMSASPVPEPAAETCLRWLWKVARLMVVAGALLAVDLVLNGRLVWSGWPIAGLGIAALVVALRNAALPFRISAFLLLACGALAIRSAFPAISWKILVLVPLLPALVFALRWLKRRERGTR